MTPGWETLESGPADAQHTVLLLPGGMCSARSWVEVMAEPALARTRLFAVTMPGHAGAPGPEDFSIEAYARSTAELAKHERVDVVAGFSRGATVAYEMAVSGLFAGPVVLLGISLSTPDEPAVFRALINLGHLLGTLPAALLKKAVSSMVKRVALESARRAELAADFARNDPRDMRRSVRAGRLRIFGFAAIVCRDGWSRGAPPDRTAASPRRARVRTR